MSMPERDELAFKMLCAWVNIAPELAPGEYKSFNDASSMEAWGRVAAAAREHIELEKWRERERQLAEAMRPAPPRLPDPALLQNAWQPAAGYQTFIGEAEAKKLLAEQLKLQQQSFDRFMPHPVLIAFAGAVAAAFACWWVLS